jgi:hypothetical protein
MPIDHFETAHWTVDDDEDEPGNPFWRGAGSGDKEESIFDPGEPILMRPEHFPIGTRVEVTEPEDPEFYARLFQDQNKEPQSTRYEDIIKSIQDLPDTYYPGLLYRLLEASYTAGTWIPGGASQLAGAWEERNGKAK